MGSSLWRRTHNLGIDTQQGIAFACGTNNGMPVVDLATDPENPRLIFRYTAEYVHDIHFRDGLNQVLRYFGDAASKRA